MATVLKVYTIDTVLRYSFSLKTADIDAVINARPVLRNFVDALFISDWKRTSNIDAYLKHVNIKTVQLDAILKPARSYLVSSVLKKSIVNNYRIDAAVESGAQKHYSVDAKFIGGSVYYFDYADNIISITEHTELYINSVAVKTSQYNLNNLDGKLLWSLSNSDPRAILSWNYLAAPLGPGDTFMRVTMSNTDLSFAGISSNIAADKIGYITIGNELIRYKNITDNTFEELDRGFGDTFPEFHTAGSYIGETMYAEPSWDNPPALQIKYPFVTAIDAIPSFEQADGLFGTQTIQARIILWEANAFGGKLAVANVAAGYTALSSSSFGTIADPASAYPWATEVAGEVFPSVTKEEVGTPTGRITSTKRWLRYIKRYGKNEIVIDNPWVESQSHATEISNALVDEFKHPRQIIQMKAMGNPALQLGDQITVVNYPQLGIKNKQYNIISINYGYDGGIVCDILARELKIKDTSSTGSTISTRYGCVVA